MAKTAGEAEALLVSLPSAPRGDGAFVVPAHAAGGVLVCRLQNTSFANGSAARGGYADVTLQCCVKLTPVAQVVGAELASLRAALHAQQCALDAQISDLKSQIADLNARIDAACADEDFELADELETQMRNLRAELRAAAEEAQAVVADGGGGGGGAVGSR